jgi:hypothetical protein
VKCFDREEESFDAGRTIFDIAAGAAMVEVVVDKFVPVVVMSS